MILPLSLYWSSEYLPNRGKVDPAMVGTEREVGLAEGWSEEEEDRLGPPVHPNASMMNSAACICLLILVLLEFGSLVLLPTLSRARVASLRISPCPVR